MKTQAVKTQAVSSIFVVFEGPEGAGKSTQVARLAARLRAHGHEPIATKEPGGTPVGERIRSIVLLEPDLAVSPLTEFLLYSASRAQHVQDVIAPALHSGQTVLCDRFYGSSIAYQGHGRGLDLGFIGTVTREATGDLRPDLVLLLDLEPEVGLERIAARGARDRLERADLAFHRRVRAGFLQQAEACGWTVLDATQDEAALAASVWDAVRPALAGR